MGGYQPGPQRGGAGVVHLAAVVFVLAVVTSGTAALLSGGGKSVPSGAAQKIAASMLGSYGWPSDQFPCLDELWNRESGWSTTADNPESGAYGIPQSLPAGKMASAGADWQTSAVTQIRWGLGYIKGRYGSPCGAWRHEVAAGWY